VGISRELIYCSVFERILRERGFKTEFLFFVDDFDSIKKFPPAVPKEFTKHTEYLGKPMYNVPCPYNHCESWGKHYGQELLDTFPSFGLYPKITWSHNLYDTSEMKNVIRTTLERVQTLREILLNIVGPTLKGEKLESFKKDLQTWYPCLVLCEKCGKLKTTQVTGHNPSKDTVSYICTDCGYKGEVAIRNWKIKLRWRIDWPAKWYLFKVSCEPAGKDHCVKGGAYDTGEEICRKIFGRKGPYRIPYEWLLLGDRAMKTHKGISFTFAEWLAVAPPETLRFMILREDPRKHISFLPERMPQLIDEFERAEQIYFGIEKTANVEEEKSLKYIYPLTLPQTVSKSPPVRLPYRFAIILSQLQPLLSEEKILGKSIDVVKKLYGKTELTQEEVEGIKERLRKAQYWVKNYAPEEMKIKITDSISLEIKQKLDEKQKQGLQTIAEMMEGKDWSDRELQYEIFELGKKLGIGTKIFEAVYLTFLGKKFGPRLAPFLLSLEREFAIKRLREAV
jgi:lysyl-tRNA synthetase class 1